MTRRGALKAAGLVAASAVMTPYVRGAASAGRLAVAVSDHGVPGANEALSRLCRGWADSNHVEMLFDVVTSTATATAEAQAGTGHDIMAHPPWQIGFNRRMLEPVNDVVESLITRYGPVSPVAEYLGRHDGVWRGVPATLSSQAKPCCSRLDLYRQYCGLDLARIFPGDDSRDPALVDGWTWELYLKSAAQLFDAGYPVGLTMSRASDAVDWTGALFRAFGVVAIDERDAIRINSDATRAALEFMQRLMSFNPPQVYAWDDIGNNRWLISGKGSGIMNPPSAWAAARRENPKVAEQCWTHDMPRGPNGRFVAQAPFFYGIWSFSASKAAAKDLLAFISSREPVRQLVAASTGFDLPAFASFHDLETWRDAGPPAGTLYNYPLRGDQQGTIAGYPARPGVAFRIYSEALLPRMIAKLTQDRDGVDGVIDWAERELEGFLCRRRYLDCA